ncbi:Hypothetical predicted protein, partial [Marmota monax]
LAGGNLGTTECHYEVLFKIRENGIQGRWRRGECITPVRCFTVWEYDKSGRLKDILLGISSNSGVRRNLEEGFPSHEDRLRGLKRERFVARR